MAKDLKKRIFAGLMAFVLFLGMVPSGVITTSYAVDSSAPSKLTFGGRKYAESYNSPNWNSRSYIHNFSLKDGTGQEYVGFCMNHKKDPPNASTTWRLDWTKESNEIAVAFLLDWYFYYHDGDGMGEWSEWEDNIGNAICQAALWLWREGRFTDPNNTEQMQKLANERNAVLRAYNPDYISTDTESMEHLQALYQRWQNGEFPHGTYANYNPSNGAVQPILIRILDPDVPADEEHKGWIKLMKTDTEGNGKGGAQFTVYEDSACTVQAVTIDGGPAVITTGADGNGATSVFWRTNIAMTNIWRQ